MPAAPLILLVEDDPLLAELTLGALGARAYHTLHADNRGDALEQLRRHSEIAVIIVDLGLPPCENDMREGLALITAIQAQAHPAKIIVLTGQDQEAAAYAAIKEGAFDFLGKPCPMPQILAAIERALLFRHTEQEMQGQGYARINFNAVTGEGLKQVRDEAEERLVRHVLQDTRFNIHESARRLGIKRENVYYFLKKFGIVRPRDEGTSEAADHLPS